MVGRGLGSIGSTVRVDLHYSEARGTHGVMEFVLDPVGDFVSCGYGHLGIDGHGSGNVELAALPSELQVGDSGTGTRRSPSTPINTSYPVCKPKQLGYSRT